MKRLLSVLALCAALTSHAEETVRPEVAKPLKAAQELIKAGKARDALTQLREADAIANRTAYEIFVIERMRGSAAIMAGDNETALRAFDAVLASGRLPPEDQLRTLEVLAGTALRAKDYARSAALAQRAIKEGASSIALHRTLAQALFYSGQYGEAARELTAQIHAADQQGKAAGELELQLLANCQAKLDDRNGYADTLVRLVTHYPKKEYWNDALNRIRNKPSFSDRLTLDLYRLRLATGVWAGAEDDVDMAQLALQAGVPAEAKRVIDAGYAAGRLGTGPDAERHKRLHDLITKQVAEDARGANDELSRADAAKDGLPLTRLGLALVMAGDRDRGLAAIERGIAKGGLKQPWEAQLHYGVALAMAGRIAAAISALGQVKSPDGANDLARLWIAHLNQAGAGKAATGTQ